MGLAVERLPLTLHWKKLYISGRSNDNDKLLGIDYGSSHIVALQRSSVRSPMTGVAKTKQGLNGATRLNPYRLAKHRLTAVGMRQKSPRSRSEAICFKSYPQHM